MPSNAVARTVERGTAEYIPFGAVDKINLSIHLVKTLLAVPTKSGVKCSDDEALKFIAMCKAKRMNPYEGDAYLIGYDAKDGAKFSLIAAHQTYLKRAEVHPEFDGMKSGLIIINKADETMHEVEGDFFRKDLSEVIGGWATVFFKQRKYPMTRKVRLDRFFKPFGVWLDDAAGMICKCFDPETEVLTTRGFEKFANAEGRVLQVTECGLEATDAVPFVQDYSGDMVEHRSRNGNFLVTTNHDLLIGLNGKPQTKIEAGELIKLRQRDLAIMPLTVTHSAAEYPISDNVIELAAAYISDGSDNSASSGFTIAVSRKDKVNRLTELALHRSCNVKPDGGGTATLSTGRTITTQSDKIAFYYSRTPDFTSLVGRAKEINHDTILKLSMRQARILIDTWTDYDGHCPAKMRCGRVYTSRLNHVRALELIAVVAGYSVNKPTSRESEGGKTRYQITLTDRTNVRLLKSAIHPARNASGKVWCVTVPTHKIVVRRNGFSFVSGQCAEADALRSSFPTMLGGLYMREELSPVIEIDGPKFSQPRTETVTQPTTTTRQSEPESSGNLGERPLATDQSSGSTSSNTSDPLSPQEQVCKIVIGEGYNFDQFKIWAVGTGILVDDSVTSFEEIPIVKAKKMIESKVGMLKGLAAVKASEKKESK